MKRFVIGLVALIGSMVFAFGFEKQIDTNGFSIVLQSPKNFTSGQNEFTLSLKQGDKPIRDSKISVKFMMPEMPGMPKMTQEATISANGDTYKGVVAFPHGGTWQIRIQFEVDSKSYQAKSSIDF